MGLAGQPWFYTPPLMPSLGCTHALLPVCGAELPRGIVAPGATEAALSVQALDRERPEYVLVSEFEYFDPLRLHTQIGYTDGMTALMEALNGRYRLARTFRNRPSLGPFRWFSARTARPRPALSHARHPAVSANHTLIEPRERLQQSEWETLDETTRARDPHTTIRDYLASLRLERGLSENTVSAYGRDLWQFVDFLEEIGGDCFPPATRSSSPTRRA